MPQPKNPNALDNLTEQVVMEAVENLQRKITVIIISHRLNIVKNCDIIFLLDNQSPTMIINVRYYFIGKELRLMRLF